MLHQRLNNYSLRRLPHSLVPSKCTPFSHPHAKSSSIHASEELTSTEPHGKFVWRADHFDEKGLDLLWDSCPRPLLRLGKTGARESHIRSLVELVTSHHSVKIQLNGDPSPAQTVAENIIQGGEGNLALVQIRGRTIQIAHQPSDTSSSTWSKNLLESATFEMGKIRKYHEKRKNEGQAVYEDPSQDQNDNRPFKSSSNRSFTSSSISSRPKSRDGFLPSPSGGTDRPVRGGLRTLGRPSSSRSSSPPPPLPEATGANINDLISKVSRSSSKRPLTKDSLKEEWTVLANEIIDVEAREAKPGRVIRTTGGASAAGRGGAGRTTAGSRGVEGGGGASNPSPPPQRGGTSKPSKAPWRQEK